MDNRFGTLDREVVKMKCDELKVETIVPQGSAITLQMYGKAEVDEAILELKNKLNNAIIVAEYVDKLETENTELNGVNNG